MIKLSPTGTLPRLIARLQWDAVYCGEKLSPGDVNTIAREVANFAQLITDHDKWTRFQAAADEFVRLLDRRNALVHANPATVGGEERFISHGTPQQPLEVEDLADESEVAGFVETPFRVG